MKKFLLATALVATATSAFALGNFRLAGTADLSYANTGQTVKAGNISYDLGSLKKALQLDGDQSNYGYGLTLDATYFPPATQVLNLEMGFGVTAGINRFVATVTPKDNIFGRSISFQQKRTTANVGAHVTGRVNLYLAKPYIQFGFGGNFEASKDLDTSSLAATVNNNGAVVSTKSLTDTFAEFYKNQKYNTLYARVTLGVDSGVFTASIYGQRNFNSARDITLSSGKVTLVNSEFVFGLGVGLNF